MNTSGEERQAMFELGLKKILYGLPAAGPIMEVMFEYGGKVKQERFNRFVEHLDKAFLKHGIDIYSVQTEENVDLFETIFRKVVQTRSEQKRNGFKNLLIHGIKNQDEIDYCEMFSEALLNISEKELEILMFHKKFLIDETGVFVMWNKLKAELDELNDKMARGASLYKLSTLQVHPKPEEHLTERYSEAKKMLKHYEDECNADKFSLTEYEYKYFLQNLFAKGLLSDDGVGTMDTNAFEIMSLTKMGIKFLSFIEDTNDQKQAD